MASRLHFNKRGISPVIATVLLVALTIGLGAVVWTTFQSIVRDNISQTSACSEYLTGDQIFLVPEFTCFDSNAQELRIGIGRGEKNLERLSVSIRGVAMSTRFDLFEDPHALPFLRVSNGTYENPVALPSKRSGVTYVYATQAQNIGKPRAIQITPYVSEGACPFTDSLTEISECSLS